MIDNLSRNKKVLSWAMNHMAIHSSLSESDIISAIEKEFGCIENISNVAISIVEELKSLNLINENKIAEQVCYKKQHKGDSFLRQYLKQKGISEEQIDLALKTIPPEYERAALEAQKKSRTFKNLNEKECQTKLARFLIGRGFSHGVVFDTAKEISSSRCIG